ncbi:hypothetical protein GCM10007918_38180 [Piscinibacter gummiphilus]|nr:hypothetical protein GCM10007918_38180 [Piscinibacter gummiphilus]
MHFHSLQARFVAVLLVGVAGTATAQTQSVVNPVVACMKKEKKGCTYDWDSNSNKCRELCLKKETGTGGFGHSGQTPTPQAKSSGKGASGSGPGISAAGKSPQ